MARTQARAFGAHSGDRYSSFAGKTPSVPAGHPVGRITQARAFGPGSGERYGSFAGKNAVAPGDHPVGRITQCRAFGAMSGGRYGAFTGRSPSVVQEVQPTGGYYETLPIRRPRNEDEELLIVLHCILAVLG